MPNRPVEHPPVEDRPARRNSRLATSDWLDAALEVLVEEGIGGLKIASLSTRLGVTKGSFYWHFADVGAMKSALATHCRQVRSEVVAELAALEDRPPRERIEGMTRLLSDPHRWRMEAAMRRWAETEPSMAESISELDDRVFRITEQAMRDLGFDEAEAHARATTLLYAGIGYVYAQHRIGEATVEDLRIFVEMLTRR
ncbi:TetR/AcrR family transcriptional regulator [Gordonia aurantiaca]|uniref:TetR/AcrR family transcriptional regulator n=1 Tax=Gordonia sp. B21 TaxID=3151852 RepID=UPI00326711FD